MKIKKKQKQKNSLFFNLIETKTYKNFSYSNLWLIDKEKLMFKKILNIIYQYHIRKKRILFIGMPLPFPKFLKKIKKKTKHFFIPKFVWINGLLTNQNACFYSLLKFNKHNVKKLNIKFLTKFRKKSDLIIIINDFTNSKILYESILTYKPIITLNLNNYYNFLKNYKIYKTNINFNFLERKNIFYKILSSILKKKPFIKNNFYNFKKIFKKKHIYNKKKHVYNKNKYFNKKKHVYNKNKYFNKEKYANKK